MRRVDCPVALRERRHGRWRAHLLLVALAALTGCGERAPIRIGLAGPLTDPVGVPMKNAARLAVAEINAAGGVRGRPLALVEKDDFGEPDSAVVVATALYADKVVAVVGHVWSGTTLSAAPVYNGGSDPLVELSPSSSSPDVTHAGDYTFRVCPSDEAHGRALARYAMNRLRLERGAVLYLNDEYGRGIRNTFAEEYIRLGGEITEFDPYIGNPPVIGPYIDRIVQGGQAGFLIVAGNKDEAVEVLRQSRQRGLTIPVMGGDGLEGIETAGALAEGTYVTAAYLPSYQTPANQKFVQEYRKKFPGAGDPNQPAAATYDAVYLLRDVIERAGTNRRRIRNELAKVGIDRPAFAGVTGSIAFDANGDVPEQRVLIGVVRGGTVRPAEGQ